MQFCFVLVRSYPGWPRAPHSHTQFSKNPASQQMARRWTRISIFDNPAVAPVLAGAIGDKKKDINTHDRYTEHSTTVHTFFIQLLRSQQENCGASQPQCHLRSNGPKNNDSQQRQGSSTHNDDTQVAVCCWVAAVALLARRSNLGVRRRVIRDHSQKKVEEAGNLVNERMRKDHKVVARIGLFAAATTPPYRKVRHNGESIASTVQQHLLFFAGSDFRYKAHVGHLRRRRKRGGKGPTTPQHASIRRKEQPSAPIPAQKPSQH